MLKKNKGGATFRSMSARRIEFVILFRRGQDQPPAPVGSWPTLREAADERCRLDDNLSPEQRIAGWKYTIRRSYADPSNPK